jgi:sortase A
VAAAVSPHPSFLMKVFIRRASRKQLVGGTQRILFACAALLLGYCGYVLLDAWKFQHQETRILDRVPSSTKAAESPAASFMPGAIEPDGLIGRIEIQRLGVSVVVVEGTSPRALRRAVGHILGTALPGQAGNIGIAAHRDTFFRPLRNIRRDDVITLTTLGGEYRYRVVSTKVVKPSNIAVLNSDGKEILTLVTCYPFYFVGSAPDRFIVRAERSYDRNF